jgi:hypothetical protein
MRLLIKVPRPLRVEENKRETTFSRGRFVILVGALRFQSKSKKVRTLLSITLGWSPD